MGLCGNVDSVAPEDPNAPVIARKSSKGIFGFLRKGNGRMEGPPAEANASAAPSRDGLHSAPSGETKPVVQNDVIAPKGEIDRAGLLLHH